jgi:hypothetical protein
MGLSVKRELEERLIAEHLARSGAKILYARSARGVPAYERPPKRDHNLDRPRPGDLEEPAMGTSLGLHPCCHFEDDPAAALDPGSRSMPTRTIYHLAGMSSLVSR